MLAKIIINVKNIKDRISFCERALWGNLWLFKLKVQRVFSFIIPLANHESRLFDKRFSAKKKEKQRTRFQMHLA